MAKTLLIKNGRVVDPAEYLENGQLDSEGFSYVIIGGEIAFKDDKIINGRLGRSVRRSV